MAPHSCRNLPSLLLGPYSIWKLIPFFLDPATSDLLHFLPPLFLTFSLSLSPMWPQSPPVSFSLSHQLYSFETTSLNWLWHPGIWQLSFCSAFHLLQLVITASGFWNGSLLLTPSSVASSSRVLETCILGRTCIHQMQLDGVYLYCNWIRIQTWALLSKTEILYCTNYAFLSTHWHSCEKHLKLWVQIHIWNVHIHFQRCTCKKIFLKPLKFNCAAVPEAITMALQDVQESLNPLVCRMQQDSNQLWSTGPERL